MGILDLTLNQLVRATKKQIIDAIVVRLNGMTERRLKEFVWEIKGLILENLEYKESVEIENIDSPNGQVLRIRETKDLLGQVLSKQRTEWTYYPTGPVNEVAIIQLDATDKEIARKVIKHFLDGRQPVEI